MDDFNFKVKEITVSPDYGEFVIEPLQPGYGHTCNQSKLIRVKGQLSKMTDTEKVVEYMNKLDHPLKAEIDALRVIIKNANIKLSERIKWNAPSYFYIADMAAFNLRATKYVQIIFIFPKGLINDNAGLLEGDWKDRREARFYNLEDVKSKKSAVEEVVNAWVKLIDE